MTKLRKSFVLTLVLFLCGIMCGFPVRAKAAMPGTPKIKSVKHVGVNSVRIKWNKVNGARAYEVYCAKDRGKFKRVAKTRNCACTRKMLEPGHSYRFKLKAVNGKRKSRFSSVKKITLPRLVRFTPFYDLLFETEGYTVKHTVNGVVYEYLISAESDDETDRDVIWLELETGNYLKQDDTLELRGIVLVMIDPVDWKKGIANISYTYLTGEYDDEHYGDAEGTMIIADYRLSQSLPIKVTELKGFSENEYIADANRLFRMAFPQWDAMLKKEYGISLYNLGFNL